MLCYRDRTYCSNQECSNFQNCDRALTPEVQAQAKKWWGSDSAPIAISNFNCEAFNENKVHDMGSGNRDQ